MAESAVEDVKERTECDICGYVYHKTGYPFRNPQADYDEFYEYCHGCRRRVTDVCTFVPGAAHICSRCSRPLISFGEWLKSKQPAIANARLRPRTNPTSLWIMPLARL